MKRDVGARASDMDKADRLGSVMRRKIERRGTMEKSCGLKRSSATPIHDTSSPRPTSPEGSCHAM